VLAVRWYLRFPLSHRDVEELLKQDRSARIVIAGHAFVQNLRRGRYELAVEEPAGRRLTVAFDGLAMAI
jgi:transposase, IS6 family